MLITVEIDHRTAEDFIDMIRAADCDTSGPVKELVAAVEGALEEARGEIEEQEEAAEKEWEAALEDDDSYE